MTKAAPNPEIAVSSLQTTCKTPFGARVIHGQGAASHRRYSRKSALYTARDLANALGCTDRAIRKRLARIPTSATRGKVKLWTFDALPPTMRAELEQLATRLDTPTPAELIPHVVSRRWEPTIHGKPVALRELAPHCTAGATQLQEALQGAVEGLLCGGWSMETALPIAARDWRAVFGDGTTERSLRRHLDRIVHRDRGFCEPHRLELYLPEKLMRQAGAEPCEALLPDLRVSIEAHRRGMVEAAFVWHKAFLEVEELAASGETEQAARQQVAAVLWASGLPLAKSLDSLRKQMAGKLENWREGGRTPPEDGRKARNAERRLSLPEEDRSLIAAMACESGNLALGWRRALRSGKLSSEVTQRYIHNARRKGSVPDVVRREVQPLLDITRHLHRGEHHHRMRGAYVTRDYSQMAAGDWFQGDDVTLNHYFWALDEDGIPRAMRGQCLVFIDCRTNYILGYALICDRVYTARQIRQTILNIHDTYGLPRRGFYLERGIWQAKMIAGEKGTEIPLVETEQGLARYCEIKQATNPRAKVVERVIGMLQDEMQHLPGYAGRDEKRERYEAFQRKLAHAKRHPDELNTICLSREEYEAQIVRILEAYNNEPQTDGKLEGMSPAEAFEKLFDYSNPLNCLGPAERYLLANHRKPLKVTRNGIRLTIRGQSRYYRNALTGKHQGQQVLVWYATEEAIPETITLTTTEHAYLGEVPLEIQPAAMETDRAKLDAALAQAQEHNAAARESYRAMKRHMTCIAKMRRIPISDEATKVSGNAIEAGRKEARSAKRQEAAQRKRLAEFSIDGGHRNPRQAIEAADMEAKLDRFHRDQATPEDIRALLARGYIDRQEADEKQEALEACHLQNRFPQDAGNRLFSHE